MNPLITLVSAVRAGALPDESAAGWAAQRSRRVGLIEHRSGPADTVDVRGLVVEAAVTPVPPSQGRPSGRARSSADVFGCRSRPLSWPLESGPWPSRLRIRRQTRQMRSSHHRCSSLFSFIVSTLRAPGSEGFGYRAAPFAARRTRPRPALLPLALVSARSACDSFTTSGRSL